MKYAKLTREQYDQIIEYAQMTFECSAHDFEHTLRVKKNASLISGKDVKMDVLLPAIYLHDIARASTDKLNDKTINHAVRGSVIAKGFLNEMNLNENLINEICHCIESHNYRSSISPSSIEAKILFDADKIDGIGAVGIARLFSMSGKYGNSIYESEKKYAQDKNNENFATPNVEFKRKHMNLIKELYFEKSKEIAKNRIEFMKDFFDQLKMEIE